MCEAHPRIIADQDYRSYCENGYLLVRDFLTPQELEALRRNVSRYAPNAEELAATPQRYETLLKNSGLLQWDFPFVDDALNDVSTHPELIRFSEEMLGTTDILLSQSILWTKYAGTDDFGQDLHLDYDENSLVYPNGTGDYDQIAMILYYSDITPDLGPTYVVPWQDGRPAGGDLLWPNYRSRDDYPDLYARERAIVAPAGSLLITSIRTFHRGSAIAAREGARFTHHLLYQSARHPWMGRYRQWPRYGTESVMAGFIARATPRQRSALGFPPPGDEYWNPQTIAGVAARYPGIDMTPYRATVGQR